MEVKGRKVVRRGMFISGKTMMIGGALYLILAAIFGYLLISSYMQLSDSEVVTIGGVSVLAVKKGLVEGMMFPLVMLIIVTVVMSLLNFIRGAVASAKDFENGEVAEIIIADRADPTANYIALLESSTKCTSCGAVMSHNTNFCPNCGKSSRAGAEPENDRKNDMGGL